MIIDKKYIAVGLGIIGLLFGLSFLQGKKVASFISRDKTGYQTIRSIEDVYKVIPTTVEQLHTWYKAVTQTFEKEIAALIALPEAEYSQETVIVGLDKAIAQLMWLGAALEIIHLLSPDKEVREVGAHYYQEIQKFHQKLFLSNKALYQVLQRYNQKKDTETISQERLYFLKNTLEELKLAGLDLPDEQLEKVCALKNKLTELETQFQINIAQDNRTLTVSLDQLEGLPDDFIATLGKTEEGLFVLKSNYPTQSIIMRESVQSATRKAFSLMMQQRGYPKNIQVLNQVIQLRKQLATLLGFESYADLSLAQAMINKPADAIKLQKDLLPKALLKSQKEFELFAKNLPKGVALSENGKFYSWDYGYTVNYYKKKYYDIDEEKLAEYFPMQETLDGLFKIYQQFFGLSFKEIKNPQSWHSDVRLLEISKQDGQILGYVFLDMFPRDNKYNHAAHGGVLHARKDVDGKVCPSVGTLICNFTPARGGKPSLLKYNEVVTFFHEFGHALHYMFAATDLVSQAGTNVKRDFVEMPSQMLENWLEDKAILLQLSKHYQTGQKLEEQVIDKKLASLSLTKGSETTGQIFYGLLSLDLFDEVGQKDLDVTLKQYNQLTNNTTEFDEHNKMYCSFGHLMGYGPQYYGYLWTRILGADLFEIIKKEGLLNPVAGKRYADAILVPGGSRDPMQLVEQYLGRKPNQQAYLKKNGFQEQE